MENSHVTPPPVPTPQGATPPPVPVPPAPALAGVGAPPPVPTIPAESALGEAATPAPPMAPPAPPVVHTPLAASAPPAAPVVHTPLAAPAPPAPVVHTPLAAPAPPAAPVVHTPLAAPAPPAAPVVHTPLAAPAPPAAPVVHTPLAAPAPPAPVVHTPLAAPAPPAAPVVHTPLAAPPAPPVPSIPETASPAMPSTQAPTEIPAVPPITKDHPTTTSSTKRRRTTTSTPISRPSHGHRRTGAAPISSRKNSSSRYEERIPLPAGTRVGNYTITSKIGVGGFGIVYAANDIADGSPVAIKEHMPEGLAMRDPNGTLVHAAPDSEERFKATVGEFLEEVTVLMGISNPGIVPILTAFEANGTAYYVMPFKKGEPMTAFEQGGSLDSTEQAQKARHNKRLLLSLLSTLDYLRMHQIVHRDIKPDNILITEEGNTILLDFGSARQLQPGKVFTNVFTPDFSAPEQSHAESDAEMSASLGPWTDLYALGVCFYYLITHLFPPRSELRVLSATDPYTPLAGRADLEVLYGASFLRAIDRALELKISDRWQSAAAWRIAIGEGMVPTQVKKARRRIRPSTLVTIGTLALFAGVSTWALVERSRALAAYENSARLNESLLLDISREISDLPGATHLQSIMGDHLTTYLSGAHDAPGAEDEQHLRTQAASWRNLGNICAEQDRTDVADDAYQNAIEPLQKLVAAHPDSLIYPYALATVLLERAKLAQTHNQPAEAVRYLSEAKDILGSLCQKAPQNPDFFCALGAAMREENQITRAETAPATYEKNLAHNQNFFRELLSSFPDHVRTRKGMGLALHNSARLAVEKEKYGEAINLLEQARELFASLSLQFPYQLAHKRALARTFYSLGDAHCRLSSSSTNEKDVTYHNSRALDFFHKHNALVSYLGSQEKTRAEHPYMLCRSLAMMVDILLRNKQYNLAAAYCKSILRETNKLLLDAPGSKKYTLLAARAWHGLALAHLHTPELADAATEELHQYRDIVAGLLKREPDLPSLQFLYTDALLESANLAADNGKPEAARAWLKEAQNILDKLIQTNPARIGEYSARKKVVTERLRSLPK